MTGPTLFVCATPLGHLGDLSHRLADCLKDVAAVFAEDTRRSRVLLDHMGLKKPLHSLHAHNERSRTHHVLEMLGAGQDVAVLTDAGTPVVSDPGADVVAAAHAAGFRVSPIPGPSALTAALLVSGFALGHTPVWFVGFLATRGKERAQMLDQLVNHRGTAVLFESPQRLGRTLTEIAELMPEREACVCRELTKVYEEVRREALPALAAWANAATVRGELTVVLGPTPAATDSVVMASDADVDAAIKHCLQAGLSTRDTAVAVAAILQRNKREIYARCVQLA